MKETEFIKYWEGEYPESHPINHELKSVYKDRWFRILSLPESKRYAETEREYEIILQRQNEILDSLIGQENEFALSLGLYSPELTKTKLKEINKFGEFEKVKTIDLRKERPEEYKDEMYYDVYVKVDDLNKRKHDSLLKAIADDEIRAMFVCPSNRCIVAPYDGGVDIITDSTEKRDELKIKYQEWLSEREDGM